MTKRKDATIIMITAKRISPEIFVVFVIFFLDSRTTSIVFAAASGCSDIAPLGIANGFISSSKLSASSSYNSGGYPARYWGPSQARLKTSSCWCGGNPDWKSDWIQVDLGTNMELTGIAIQGDPLDPPNDIEEFFVQLSDDGVVFKNVTRVTDEHGHNVIHVSPSRDSDDIRYFWSQISVTSRFVRIRPIKLLLIGHNAKFCLRFELYGCLPSTRDPLYPIGLENGIIPDSHMSASSSHTGEPAHHARLNMRNSWCADKGKEEWLQFDLGRILEVKAITTQGRYGRTSSDVVSTYYLTFSNSSTWPNTSLIANATKEKIYIGNNGTSQDPVLNFVDPPVIARYVRIHAMTAGPTGIGGSEPKEYCLRAEIYAQHQSCSARVSTAINTTYYSLTNGLHERLLQSYDIHSMYAWCADVSSQTKILQIDLQDVRLLSGVAISGNPNGESWVTGFDMRLGLDSTKMKTAQNFKGTISRTDVAVNWFQKLKIARFVEIVVKKFVGHKCLRIRMLGCLQVPITVGAPVTTVRKVTTSSLLIDVKAPTSSNISANSTLIVAYTCVNSSTCSNATESVVTFETYGSYTAVNVSGLASKTRYRLTIRLVYDESLSKTSTIETTTEAPVHDLEGRMEVTNSKKTAMIYPTISNGISAGTFKSSLLLQSIGSSKHPQPSFTNQQESSTMITKYHTVLFSQHKDNGNSMLKEVTTSQSKSLQDAGNSLESLMTISSIASGTGKNNLQSQSLTQSHDISAASSIIIVEATASQTLLSFQESRKISTDNNHHLPQPSPSFFYRNSSTELTVLSSQKGVITHKIAQEITNSALINTPGESLASKSVVNYSVNQETSLFLLEYTPCWITYHVNATTSNSQGTLTLTPYTNITEILSTDKHPIDSTLSTIGTDSTNGNLADVFSKLGYPTMLSSSNFKNLYSSPVYTKSGQTSFSHSLSTSLLKTSESSAALTSESKSGLSSLSGLQPESGFSLPIVATSVVSTRISAINSPLRKLWSPSIDAESSHIRKEETSMSITSTYKTSGLFTSSTAIIYDPWTSGGNIINRKRRDLLPVNHSVQPSFSAHKHLLQGTLSHMEGTGSSYSTVTDNGRRVFSTYFTYVHVTLTSSIGLCPVNQPSYSAKDMTRTPLYSSIFIESSMKRILDSQQTVEKATQVMSASLKTNATSIFIQSAQNFDGATNQRSTSFIATSHSASASMQPLSINLTSTYNVQTVTISSVYISWNSPATESIVKTPTALSNTFSSQYNNERASAISSGNISWNTSYTESVIISSTEKSHTLTSQYRSGQILSTSTGNISWKPHATESVFNTPNEDSNKSTSQLSEKPRLSSSSADFSGKSSLSKLLVATPTVDSNSLSSQYMSPSFQILSTPALMSQSVFNYSTPHTNTPHTKAPVPASESTNLSSLFSRRSSISELNASFSFSLSPSIAPSRDSELSNYINKASLTEPLQSFSVLPLSRLNSTKETAGNIAQKSPTSIEFLSKITSFSTIASGVDSRVSPSSTLKGNDSDTLSQTLTNGRKDYQLSVSSGLVSPSFSISVLEESLLLSHASIKNDLSSHISALLAMSSISEKFNMSSYSFKNSAMSVSLSATFSSTDEGLQEKQTLQKNYGEPDPVVSFSFVDESGPQFQTSNYKSFESRSTDMTSLSSVRPPTTSKILEENESTQSMYAKASFSMARTEDLSPSPSLALLENVEETDGLFISTNLSLPSATADMQSPGSYENATGVKNMTSLQYQTNPFIPTATLSNTSILHSKQSTTVSVPVTSSVLSSPSSSFEYPKIYSTENISRYIELPMETTDASSSFAKTESFYMPNTTTKASNKSFHASLSTAVYTAMPLSVSPFLTVKNDGSATISSSGISNVSTLLSKEIVTENASANSSAKPFFSRTKQNTQSNIEQQTIYVSLSYQTESHFETISSTPKQSLLETFSLPPPIFPKTELLTPTPAFGASDGLSVSANSTIQGSNPSVSQKSIITTPLETLSSFSWSSHETPSALSLPSQETFISQSALLPDKSLTISSSSSMTKNFTSGPLLSIFQTRFGSDVLDTATKSAIGSSLDTSQSTEVSTESYIINDHSLLTNTVSLTPVHISLSTLPIGHSQSSSQQDFLHQTSVANFSQAVYLSRSHISYATVYKSSLISTDNESFKKKSTEFPSVVSEYRTMISRDKELSQTFTLRNSSSVYIVLSVDRSSEGLKPSETISDLSLISSSLVSGPLRTVKPASDIETTTRATAAPATRLVTTTATATQTLPSISISGLPSSSRSQQSKALSPSKVTRTSSFLSQLTATAEAIIIPSSSSVVKASASVSFKTNTPTSIDTTVGILNANNVSKTTSFQIDSTNAPAFTTKVSASQGLFAHSPTLPSNTEFVISTPATIFTSQTQSFSAKLLDSESIRETSKAFSAMTSYTSPIFTPLVTATPPSVYGLAYVPLNVPQRKDVTTQTYEISLEAKIIATYNLLRYKRKRRAVSLAGNTAQITILARKGLTEFVDVVFYVMEAGRTVAAQRTVDILNQMTLSGLTQKFGETVLGPVVVYGTTTAAPSTTVTPTSQELLAMVLNNVATNNLTIPSNIALFENRIAEYYSTVGSAVFKVFYIVDELKRFVYMELYVKVNGKLQRGSTVETFFKTKTTSALSAVLSWTVIASPYALSNIRSTNANHLQMTVRIVSSTTDVSSQSFKSKVSAGITEIHWEAKYGAVNMKTRGSVTTFIVSSTLPNQNQAKIVFFILDKGKILLASAVLDVFKKTTANRMSLVLGLEILSGPSSVTSLVPTSVSPSDSYIWIIAVSVAAFLLLLLIVTCVCCRWKNGFQGNLKSKLTRDDVQRVDLPPKVSLELRDKQMMMNGAHTMYAQSESHGPAHRKFVNFASPTKAFDFEREREKQIRSKRKKVGRGRAHQTIADKRRSYEEAATLTTTSDSTESISWHQSYRSDSNSYLRARDAPASKSTQTSYATSFDDIHETSFVSGVPASNMTYQNVEHDDEHLYESIKQFQKSRAIQTPSAASLPPVRQLNYTDTVKEGEDSYQSGLLGNSTYVGMNFPLIRQIDYSNTAEENEIASQRRFHQNPVYSSRTFLNDFSSISNDKTAISAISADESKIEETLKQKAELERSKNKLRQRERIYHIQRDADTESSEKSRKSSSQSSFKEKAAKWRNKRWRSYKVDVSDYEEEHSKRPPVKLNNYVQVASPAATTQIDTKTEENPSRIYADIGDVKLQDAKERLHTLMDDAFSLMKQGALEAHDKEHKPTPRVPIHDDPFTVKEETTEFQGAPTEMPFESTEATETQRDRGNFHEMLLQRPLASSPPWHISPLSQRSSNAKFSPGSSKEKTFASYLLQDPQPATPQLYKITPASLPYLFTPPLEQHVYLTPVPRSFENTLYNTLEDQEECVDEPTIEEKSPMDITQEPRIEQIDYTHNTLDQEPSTPYSLIQYIKKELLNLTTSRRNENQGKKLAKL